MKKTSLAVIFLATILGVSLSWAGIARQAEDPGVLLRAAIEKEEVDGDLQGAIALYKQIVATHSEQSAVAAKAQLRIGICYEKLGNTEAVKAYEAVLSRFPKEAEAVAQARARLAALRQEEPKGLTMKRISPQNDWLECPALSPGGTKIAGIDMSNGQNVVYYDLATGKMEFVTNNDWSRKSCHAYTPVWSPDGREIVYWGACWGDPNEADAMLWISTLDGKSRVLFRNTDGGGIAPCDWLPGNSAVVAFKGAKDGLYSLVLISTGDGACRILCPLQRTFKAQDMPMAEASVSADASPDGRLIVFADGPNSGSRDIYLIATEGGSPVPLIDHPGDDKEPRWSPDGRHIVFLSDRHGSWALWGVAVRDGETEGPPFMILEGMEDHDLVSWTKNGVQTRTGLSFSEISILEIAPQSHAVLGKPRILDLPTSELHLGPFWSPDGRYLSFLSYSRPFFSGEVFCSIMPSEGGEVRKFKYDSSIHPIGGKVRWLPDGSGLGAIVWDSEKRIYFSRLELGTGKWTTRQIPAQGFSAFQQLAWSSDGKAFFYIKKGEDGYDLGLIARELETGEERFLYRAQPGDSFGWNFKPSRDHKQLALDIGGKTLIVDTETGHNEKLEYGGKKQLFSPAWSPDGKYLVAKGEPERGGTSSELFIVSVADGTYKSLNIHRYLPPNSQIVTSPDWSPDGRKIAFDTRMWKSETNLIQNVIPKK